MRKFTGSTRKEEMAKLTNCYLKLRNLSLIQLGLLVAALITAIVKAMLPSVLCMLGMALLRITLHRKWRQDYRQAITDATLACSVGPKLDQFELSAKGGTGISPGDVSDAELIPVREGVNGNIAFYQGISGSWRGMEISMNDTTLQLPPQDGQKGIEIACGVWIRIVLPKDTCRNFRILSIDILPDDLRRAYMKSRPALRKRDEQKAGFREKLYVYEERLPDAPVSAPSAPDPVPASLSGESDAAAPPVVSGAGSAPAAVSAFPSFSNTVLSAVSGLFRKTSGKPAISVKGNVLNVFIRDQLLAHNYPANSKPEESYLQFDPIPEFRDVLRLAESL
ncbi:MAG: hypothetical protein Q4D81_06625 [Eubacteriales bacterium]|nr:hypothetical protein [Eubacteriales bacterium]